MATDLLELSARIIDTGDLETPTNRVNLELSEVADGVAVVEAFSHVWAVRTDAGLVLFDASSDMLGAAVTSALRSWSTEPVDTIVYTHGHRDHVGGAPAFLADADARGHRRPTVLAHEAVAQRDTPLLLGIILVGAMMVIAINLVVDVAYAALDPRVGSGQETAA